MSRVNACVLTGFGLNCDHETAFALQQVGAEARRVHINTLIQDPGRLDDFQLLVFGGGFSWGDDHGAGVIQAVRMRTRMGAQMRRFIEAGNLVLGICNGFQTLVNLGLLPGIDEDYSRRAVALTHNDCGNFRDQWVRLAAEQDSVCIFTKNLRQLDLPVRHGEGKLVADRSVIERLEAAGQVALRYANAQGNPAGGQFPDNPNGSMGDIAGICDATGRVFGLMPHPEAYNHWTNHPDWTLLKERCIRQNEPLPTGLTPGLQLLQNAVTYLQETG